MSSLKGYCRITALNYAINGEKVKFYDEGSNDSWGLQIYRSLKLNYPKFHKMDQLSQFGFLASEILKKHLPDQWELADDEMSMVFANRSASAITDIKFLESYQNLLAPSPSVFVYTLPNVVMGEIAIYNKWYGENMFAILSKFESEFFIDYAHILKLKGSKAILGCWLEVTSSQMDIFAFIADLTTAENGFSKENLEKCYASNII